MIKPRPTAGLRHVALFTQQFEACVHFYTKLIGMHIEWQPDDDNVYLTSGNDNLALHRTSMHFHADKQQRLDHIGFIIDELEQVDVWYHYLKDHQVIIKTKPRNHRDGAKSFYCEDPDGNTVQMIYHPPLAKHSSNNGDIQKN